MANDNLIVEWKPCKEPHDADAARTQNVHWRSGIARSSATRGRESAAYSVLPDGALILGVL